MLKLPEKVQVTENDVQGQHFISPPIEQDEHESTSRFEEQSPENVLPKTRIKEGDKITLDLKSAG